MSIRLLALDLDGTTLRKDCTISPRTARALRLAREAGVTVTLCTGRLHSSALLFARRLGLHAPLISAAGGLIRDPGGLSWLHRPLAPSIAPLALRAAQETGVQTELYVTDTLYVADVARKRKELYHPRRLLKVRSLDGLRQTLAAVTEYRVAPMAGWRPSLGLPDKVMLTDPDPARLQAAVKLILDGAGHPVTVTTSEATNLEITAEGATKGTAVSWLAERLGVAIDQVMVAGDSLNDHSMFELDCFKVAMGNAHPRIKAMASRVTASHVEDGVARAVERFVLEEVPA